MPCESGRVKGDTPWTPIWQVCNPNNIKKKEKKNVGLPPGKNSGLQFFGKFVTLII